MRDLAAKRCRPIAEGTPPLAADAAGALLGQLKGWTLGAGGGAIERCFKFRDFHDTMAFVNAVAWVAHREDHHPDLEVGYGRCVVRFTTHAVGGLSENDFIAAAQVDALGL